jgi:ATP-dependent Clp protease ATP-binding subunit ClpC
MNVLRQHFRPEFLNRIDDIILFKALTRDETRHVVRLQLEQVKRLARSQDIDLEFDDTVVDYLATEGYRPEFGARELRRQIRQLIENELAKEMLKGDIGEGSSIMCTYDAAEQHVKFTSTPASASGNASPGAKQRASAKPPERKLSLEPSGGSSGEPRKDSFGEPHDGASPPEAANS